MKHKIIYPAIIFIIFMVSSLVMNYGLKSYGAAISSTNIREYSVGPQDVLQIEVWDNPDLSREATVTLNGSISFPLIGEIGVEGYTSEELQQIIKKRLADGFLVDPQVTVTVKEYHSKKIYVLGQVVKPGDFPFSKATTLVELISMAGGLTEDAGQEAFILRPTSQNQRRESATGSQPLSNELAAALESTPQLPENIFKGQLIPINLNDFNQGINLNFQLKINDTIYIPKAKFFYVIGEVKSPGRFKLEKEINVLQVISMAGGLTPKANDKKIKIIRTVDGKDQELVARLTDPVLPEDIVKVPESFF